MEFKITLDITDKFAGSLAGLADALRSAARIAPVAGVPGITPETAPATSPEPEAVNSSPEPESCAGDPPQAVCEPDPKPAPKADPEPAPKPTKKKSAKKSAENASVTPPKPEAGNSSPEPDTPAGDPPQAVCEPDPEPTPKAASEPADDGMCGMSLMEAARKVIEDIQAKGVEMSDANSRVRAKAGELGLNFGSITCLIKAIGYVEARRIALGE